MSPKRSSTITTSTTSAFATLSTEETVADASNGTKKRAASPPTEDEADYVDESTQSQSQSQPSRKKSRLSIVETQVESQVATSSQARVQPTNRVLPVDIKFPKKAVGSIRIAGWNVTSLASSQKKGFKFYVEAEDADILILTETKVNNPPADPVIAARYPYTSWSMAEKKGYAGTAILSKIKPLSTSHKLPGFEPASLAKGRTITLEFEQCWVIGTYVPNAGDKLKNMDTKKAWNKAFDEYVHSLDKTKPVIWVGDMNVAPTAKDIKNDKSNWNKSAGYTEIETTAWRETLNPTQPERKKLIDVWRQLHPDDKAYSYFSFKFQAREKGIGWRLDMAVVSERLLPRVKLCEIRDEIWGASDHCPIVLEIDGPL